MANIKTRLIRLLQTSLLQTSLLIIFIFTPVLGSEDFEINSVREFYRTYPNIANAIIEDAVKECNPQLEDMCRKLLHSLLSLETKTSDDFIYYMMETVGALIENRLEQRHILFLTLTNEHLLDPMEQDNKENIVVIANRELIDGKNYEEFLTNQTKSEFTQMFSTVYGLANALWINLVMSKVWYIMRIVIDGPESVLHDYRKAKQHEIGIRLDQLEQDLLNKMETADKTLKVIKTNIIKMQKENDQIETKVNTLCMKTLLISHKITEIKKIYE